MVQEVTRVVAINQRSKHAICRWQTVACKRSDLYLVEVRVFIVVVEKQKQKQNYLQNSHLETGFRL